MKLIKSKVTNLTPTSYNYNDIIKHIELCGRTCYKSEDKITDSSTEKFINMLKSNHHMSVLEHGTVYLDMPMNDELELLNNPYSTISYYIDENNFERIAITTNYRVILENSLGEYFKLYSLNTPTKYHEQRYTFRITCSRAIANEIVRHRQMSYSQESTRYCNYSKSKFGGEQAFILPEKLNMLPEGNCEFCDGINYRIYPFNSNNFLDSVSINPNNFTNSKEIDNWLNSLYSSSEIYFNLLTYGWKPEEARGVLPLDLKTDLIVTGTKSQWDAFFKLRCAKSAHPDIQVIANQIKSIIYKEILNKYII